LAKEQYGEVMYLTISYPQLLILITNLYSNYGIYMCRSECHGCKIIYQVTLLCASTGQPLNSSKYQRNEGKTKVMSLNTPTAPIDISTNLRK
jgi:hypothetical protein